MPLDLDRENADLPSGDTGTWLRLQAVGSCNKVKTPLSNAY
jgi:hypothetical protein